MNDNDKTRDSERDELTREFSIEIDRTELDARAASKSDDGTLPISISSEYPVLRDSYWEDGRYYEVLVHSKDAVDLSRAKDGLPFLDSHNSYDGSKQLGLVKNIKLGDDGKLRGDVKFSRRQAAQDLRADMLDGIRTMISVGYRIDRNNLEKTQKKEGEVPTVRVKRWTPYEVSSVSIPADPTVGVGRSARDDAPRSPSIITSARRGQEHTVKDENTAAGNGTATAENAAGEKMRAEWENNATETERKRSDNILAIAAGHEIGFDKVREWQTSPKSIGEIAIEALNIAKERGKTKPTVGNGQPIVELTDKERSQYSFQRAAQILVDEIDNPRRAAKEGSFERDISQELEKNFPASADVKRHGGLLVPTFTSRESVLEAQYGLPAGALTRAGLDSGTATKGQELKFTVPGDFLQLLRNFMATVAAGVQILGGLQGPVAFPAQTAAGTATWTTENPGSDVADSNLLLSQVTLSPKSLMSSTSYSRQLMAQSVIDVDGMVRQDLALINAIALDLGVINGSGSSGQPTGILNTSGIGSVAGGTNGLTPTYTHLVDLETQVTAANADQWPLSYLVHPTSRGTFKKAVALANTVGLPVWTKGDVAIGAGALQGQPGARVPGELNGYPAWASAQVPNNLTKGTSSGICLAILFGAYSQAVIGDWGMMEIIVDPYRLKKQGMIELTSFAIYGVAVKYAAAFSAMKDALA